MVEFIDSPVESPFILKRYWPIIGKTVLYLPSLDNYPLTVAPSGDHQGTEIFQTTEMSGVPPIPKEYPPRTVSVIP